jgi:hypothetical protein
MKTSPKLIGLGVLILVLIIASFMVLGINDAGYRTVVQYPTGHLFVKFTPGIYMQWFGSTTIYPDVLTYDFDKEPSGLATIEQKGVAVRYQDGGTGTVFGKSRYNMPNDEPTMLKAHKAFRSAGGVAHKLVKSVTEEGMNLTAGLMSSEEAYAEKRGIYTQWAEQQISKGKFHTKLEQVMGVEKSTGQRVLKTIPVIEYGEDGRPMHFSSDLAEYGITVSGFQITDWGFEDKTLQQIARKREATMAIITAKADAERAKQEAITAEEQGKANVMTAKYEKEVEKQRAVVVAEQKKEVAVINAIQLVDVAKQHRLEAEQKKLTATEYKQEQILRGEGDAERKRLVLEADGALEQKLATYENVMSVAFTELAKQKWVPEVQMNGSSSENGGNEASNLMTLFTAKVLKDLGLDLSISQKTLTRANQ